jgi:uncharacterized protein (TIGR02594 family)
MHKDIILWAIYALGVKETDEEVKRYFKSVKMDDLYNDGETPWCAAFVSHILKQAGYKYLNTLRARSYLTTYEGEETNEPIPGDLAIFWRGRVDDGASGHVAFFLKEEHGEIHVLGGNQNDEVCVARYPKSRLLGYRKSVK